MATLSRFSVTMSSTDIEPSCNMSMLLLLLLLLLVLLLLLLLLLLLVVVVMLRRSELVIVLMRWWLRVFIDMSLVLLSKRLL